MRHDYTFVHSMGDLYFAWDLSTRSLRKVAALTRMLEALERAAARSGGRAQYDVSFADALGLEELDALGHGQSLHAPVQQEGARAVDGAGRGCLRVPLHAAAGKICVPEGIPEGTNRRDGILRLVHGRPVTNPKDGCTNAKDLPM